MMTYFFAAGNSTRVTKIYIEEYMMKEDEYVEEFETKYDPFDYDTLVDVM